MLDTAAREYRRKLLREAALLYGLRIGVVLFTLALLIRFALLMSVVNNKGLGFLIAGTTSVLVILLHHLISEGWRVWSDVRSISVKIVEGTVTVRAESGGWGTIVYTLNILSTKFIVSKKTFSSLSNRQAYRIHYAPNSKIVVNAEPL